MLKRHSTLFWWTLGYASLLFLWFLAWLTLGDWNWILTLIHRAVPYLFLPVLILAAAHLFRRRLKSMSLLAIPLLIFVAIYFPYLVPKWNFSTSRAPALRVMTYNVLFSNKNYDAIAKNILEYQPDLVALQEVQPAMMRALVERLQTTYPYFVIGTENPFGTTAIFSQHPISASRILDLQADRPAVMIRTQIQAHEIYFVAAHLVAYNFYYVKPRDIPQVTMERTAEQNRQAKIILETLAPLSGIKIIGCDCNSHEPSVTYRMLHQTFYNSARQTAWTLNVSPLANTRQDTDLQHIDYIFYQGALEPLATRIIQDSGGSDHFPVISEFTWSDDE